MIYPAIQLREDGRVVECLHCKNEEIETGDFCKICGKVIINRCAQSFQGPCEESGGKPLPGNARFCPYCGSNTTFFNDKLLVPWNKIGLHSEILTDDELPF